MNRKRKNGTQTVALMACGLWFGIALFPPCLTASGAVAPREFLFFVGDTVQINAGRLLAEALLVLALTVFALIYVWSDD